MSIQYRPIAFGPGTGHGVDDGGHLRKVIDAAQRLGVEVVGTFVGNDRHRPLPENLDRFRKIWPSIVAHASERGVRIAIENCPMIFSWDEWPGGGNLASSPAVWDELFAAVPDESFGLNLDPSHLVWLMIDEVQVVRDYGERIFHVHAKDLEIDRRGLQRHGVLSLGMGWQVPRLPGFGEVRWDASSRRSTRPDTTTRSRSSTRTGCSRARRNSSSAAS